MKSDDISWSPSPEVPFLVADWTVDAAANRLMRHGDEVRLEPKVMSVLVYLVRHRGRVVSRGDLESGVWTGMVVGYDAVTNAVIKLRRALGDDPRAPRIIETISKQGYRLIADVEPIAKPVVGQSFVPAIARPVAAEEGPLREGKHRRRPLALTAALLALLLVAPLTAFFAFRSPPDANEQVPGSSQRVAIAVLPFDDPSADPSQDYFANGITEDLITDLSKVSGLLVVARNSAFAYQDSNEPADTIGRTLGVRFLLRGSLRRDGEQLRLNVRLLDSHDGRTLWAERYDRRLTDVFRIQDELTAQIVSALQVELAPADQRRLVRNHEASVAAYDELLQGNDHYGRRSFHDNELAKEHYQRAIELDPEFARAYAALALAYSRDAVDGWRPGARASMERAAALVDQAMQLDPKVPQIYFVHSQIALYRGDLAEAVRQAEEAIALSPGYADAYAMLGLVLHYAGRPVEGLDEIERAVRLNPRLPSIYRLVRGVLHYALGDYPRAIADLEPATPMNPTYQMLRLWLAAAYAGSGRIEEAQWEATELLALNPSFTLEHVETVFPIRDPEYRERLIGDLRKSGLD